MWKLISEKVKKLSDNKFVFNFVKLSIVAFNLMQIAFAIWIAYSGMKLINDEAMTEEDPKKREILEVNKTVLIIGSIMGSFLCLLGVIGSLRESYGCMVSYSLVLAVLSLVNLISPRTKMVNLVILITMTSVSIFYSFMLKAREKKQEQSLRSANLYLASP
ncbi:hypothetical protein HDE_09878 [Halotydeus destructor]|nr:hypothetical protein HDE_09878 [Halotydeus destructor]